MWQANRDNVEIKAGYAGSLCDVGRWDEAEQLVDEVLEVVPRHPYANQLKRYIVAKPATLRGRANDLGRATGTRNNPGGSAWPGGKGSMFQWVVSEDEKRRQPDSPEAMPVRGREKGTSLISTVREGKEPQRHARKRLMQAA